MPVYEYYCPDNGQRIEVYHSINEELKTWQELCQLKGIALGDTAPNAPVTRLLFAAGISLPAGDSKLKELGFTKLVKRDNGVYENVTATKDEKRYMKAGDSSSMPDFKRKIKD